jgi:predicted DCC family thiol-disulfide oxidoreductase YuxK
MALAVDWPDDGIILYDGHCVLCSGWVRFVAKRDIEKQFRFTPITSTYGRRLAGVLNIDPDDPDTNALVLNGAARFRSDAALELVSHLPGWGWVRVLRVVPVFLRDAVYLLVARTRYRVFGRHMTCNLGDADTTDRVVTD